MADVIRVSSTCKANGPNQLGADSSLILLDAVNFIEEQAQLFTFRGIIQ
jgi:hypothetical protein